MSTTIPQSDQLVVKRDGCANFSQNALWPSLMKVWYLIHRRSWVKYLFLWSTGLTLNPTAASWVQSIHLNSATVRSYLPGVSATVCDWRRAARRPAPRRQVTRVLLILAHVVSRTDDLEETGRVLDGGIGWGSTKTLHLNPPPKNYFF